MSGAAFNLIDAATKLFIPGGLDLNFVRIQARQQFFGKARTRLRRKCSRLGRQFGDKVRHVALEKPTAPVYDGSARGGGLYGERACVLTRLSPGSQGRDEQSASREGVEVPSGVCMHLI